MIPSPPPRPDLQGPAPVPGIHPAGRPGPFARDGLARAERVTWSWLEAIGLFFVGNVLIGQVLVLGLFLALSGVQRVEDLAGSMQVLATILVDVVFAAVMVGWLARRHPGWLRRLGLPGPGAWGRAIAWGAGMGVLLYPAIAIVVGVPLTLLFEAVSGRTVTTPEQLPQHLSTMGKALSVVLAVAVAPPTEELFFRGLLFRSIRDRLGFWPGALISAVLFGLAHYVPAPWPDAVLLQTVMIFTGLGLAWIYERRGTIVANTAAHMVFNVVGLLLILGRL
ncbi:MAG: lysostaphin resistance A-like protein [Planctomycetaceae bacterium]